MGLLFQGPQRLEVLAHTAHGRHAIAAKRRDLNGALAMVDWRLNLNGIDRIK
jgi:hypothetical protein